MKWLVILAILFLTAPAWGQEYDWVPVPEPEQPAFTPTPLPSGPSHLGTFKVSDFMRMGEEKGLAYVSGYVDGLLAGQYAGEPMRRAMAKALTERYMQRGLDDRQLHAWLQLKVILAKYDKTADWQDRPDWPLSMQVWDYLRWWFNVEPAGNQ